MPCQFDTTLSLILPIIPRHENLDAISSADERKDEGSKKWEKQVFAVNNLLDKMLGPQ
jgi:hypothetical protein